MSDKGKLLNNNTVQFERLFPCSAQELFDHLSKAELLEQWLMRAVVDLKDGGRIQFLSHEESRRDRRWGGGYDQRRAVGWTDPVAAAIRLARPLCQRDSRQEQPAG